MIAYILFLLLIVEKVNLYYSIGFIIIYIVYVIMAFVQSKYHIPDDEEEEKDTQMAAQEVLTLKK